MFTCQNCAKQFDLPESVRSKYPDWTPSRCSACHASSKRPSPPPESPHTGVFTDGSAAPNPGPGGWGAVRVVDDEIVDQRSGREAHTTNNRMELKALIEGCALVPEGEQEVVFTDSKLAVDTVNTWAEGWARNGWRRKSGEIKNLELVKELYFLLEKRPELEVRWIKGHAGHRWNEYADQLATDSGTG